jgi:adenosylhomocysteine nucleosidase
MYRRIFVFFLCFVSLVLVSAAAFAGTCGDGTPRIAVISAFGDELEVLLANTEVENSCAINGVEFTVGLLEGNDIVAFLSGGSMTNAAMNTQLALDHFNITHIVYSGIAGGVSPELNIGDVTVASQWAQYQESYYGPELENDVFGPPFWLGEGVPPPFPNFGMSYPMTVTVRTDAHPEGESIFWFPVDTQMLTVAETVAENIDLADCAPQDDGSEVCLTHDPKVEVGGNGVSGQTFVNNAEYREYVYATFQASVLDMETSAVAMVAYANSVPYVAFRSLSDLAGGGPGENEIGTFFQLAADNSAAVVMTFLREWNQQ